MLEKLSIIIPVHENEKHLKILLSDLAPIKDVVEIITLSEGSRAKSMNVGAMSSTRPFLWFLHADSRVTEDNIKALEKSLREKPDALHYFDLAFDGVGATIINAWGANMRSRLFGTPYGDQGLCIAKKYFRSVGRYPENVPYGEDLMLVWHLRQAGVKLNRIPSKLLTSARKYKAQGWLKLTLLYQKRWIFMSAPEAWKLLRAKS